MTASRVLPLGARAIAPCCLPGLEVIGLDDPNAPQIVGSLDLPPAAAGVALTRNQRLVGSSMGLLVIDVSDPVQPAMTMELTSLAGPRAVVASCRHAGGRLIPCRPWSHRRGPQAGEVGSAC